MKRIILFAVSIALFISCFIFNPSNSAVKIGSTGRGEKIKTLDELISVLDFIANHDNTETDVLMKQERDQLVTLLSTKNSSIFDMDEMEESDTEEWNFDEKKDYSSATVTFNTSIISSSSCSNPKYSNGGISSSSQNFQRELTLHITEDATFYESKGELDSKITYLNDESVTVTQIQNMRFNMDIYCSGDSAYVQIREFYSHQSSGRNDWKTMQIKEEHTEKLIRLPKEFVDDLVDIDSQNRDALNSLRQMIEYLIESEEINEDDRIIRIDENDFERIAREYAEKENYEQEDNEEDDDTTVSMDFEVSLSSPSNPYIYSNRKETTDKIQTINEYNDSYNNSYGYYTSGTPMTVEVNFKSSTATTQEIKISGINETKIEIDEDKVDLIVRREEDFENLFNIEERRKSDDQ